MTSPKSPRIHGVHGTMGSGTPEYHRTWRAANHVKVRLAERRYQTSPKGQRNTAAGARMRAYGLTPAQFDAMVVESGGRCALCLRSFEAQGSLEMVVDHCHVSTEKIRGLICDGCNIALGYMERNNLDTGWLDRVQRYRI